MAEYCVCDTLLPLKYNYLLAYGVPAVVVMVSNYTCLPYKILFLNKNLVMKSQ